jgi:hypothetical protein
MGVAMHSLRIVLFSIGCAVLYGIVHDQVTARVCVEYFTVGHPSLLGLRDPTALGIVWGILATWWVGLALGLLLALVCRLGPRPTLTVRDVRGPILLVMLVIGVTSLIAGLAGYTLTRTGSLYMPYTLVTRVPAARQAAFLADAWAHQNAYNVGLVGGLAVCLWAWHERGRRMRPARPSWWGPWWRAVQRRVWDHTAPPALLPRLLAVVALAVLVVGTVGLATTGSTAAGDYERAIFTAMLGWPVVLGLFWLLGTATLLAARQPRAAGVFLVVCLIVGGAGAAILLGTTEDMGLSAIEAALVLDTAMIYAAWRLLLRPSTKAPLP